MPTQKLEGGKWYCHTCTFTHYDYNIVRDHEMTTHTVPLFQEWNKLLTRKDRQKILVSGGGNLPKGKGGLPSKKEGQKSGKGRDNL